MWSLRRRSSKLVLAVWWSRPQSSTSVQGPFTHPRPAATPPTRGSEPEIVAAVLGWRHRGTEAGQIPAAQGHTGPFMVIRSPIQRCSFSDDGVILAEPPPDHGKQVCQQEPAHIGKRSVSAGPPFTDVLMTPTATNSLIQKRWSCPCDIACAATNVAREARVESISHPREADESVGYWSDSSCFGVRLGDAMRAGQTSIGGLLSAQRTPTQNGFRT